MSASDFLEVLGSFVVAAAAVVLVARLVRMPSIVSYIVAGVLVGPVTGLVGEAARTHGGLEIAGELGIVLLMFLVGIELSFERIQRVGRVALAAGLGQVVFTAAGGMGLCLALGFELLESLFLATALTFSSTVVVVKLLDQKGELDSLYGRIAVGIFLVQDLVVIVVLTFLAGLGSGEERSAAALIASLARAFGGMALMLVGCLFAARRLLPRPWAWAARSPRTLFMWSLAWCLGYVALAHALGLSAEIGAFLAGLSLAQLGCAGELRRRMHPLMSFFVAVFFVYLGARMELAAAAEHWRAALLLSLFVLIGNPLIFLVILARFRYSERTSFLTSVTVAQISEFSFIFVAMGVSAGLVGPAVLSIVGVVGLVTIAASAYMILYNDGLYRFVARSGVLRLFRCLPGEDEPTGGDEPRGHVLVVGMNDLGRRIARTLHERGEKVLALDIDGRKLAGLACPTMIGDVGYRATLEEAGLSRARLAVSALRIEATNKLFTYRCKQAGVPVAVYAFDRAVMEELLTLGPDFLIESKAEAGRRMARELQRLGALSP